MTNSAEHQIRLIEETLIDKLNNESQEDWTDAERQRIGSMVEVYFNLWKLELKQVEEENQRTRKRDEDFFAEFERQLQKKIKEEK